MNNYPKIDKKQLLDSKVLKKTIKIIKSKPKKPKEEFFSRQALRYETAINKYDGQLFRFDFRKKTPCFRCFMPEIPENELNCETGGIMTTLAGIAGSLQANEVVKSILNMKNSMKENIMIFDALKSNFRRVKLLKNPSCKNNHFHG